MTIPLPSRHWATRVALPLCIVGAALATLAWAAWSTLMPAPTVVGTSVLVRAALPDASTTGATRASAPIQAAGWIEPAPFPVAATALVEGVVAEVLVLEGDHVKKDQVVARLVARDAELAVRQMQAEFDRRVAMAQTAQANAERMTRIVGSKVELTRVLAVAQAKAEAARATLEAFSAEERERRNALAEAEDELTRKSAAAKDGAVSEADLVRLRLRVESLKASTAALPARRAALDAAVAEAIAELDAKRSDAGVALDQRTALATAQAELAAAQAETALAQALLEQAQLRRERTEILAPIDGIVLSRLVAPGMPVGGLRDDARVALLYDPKSLQVRADVANADIALVGIGERATITLETLPNRTLTGTVTRIVGQADIQKNTVQVKISIDDPPSELRPDMLCRVRIGDATGGGGASRQRVFAPLALVDGETACVVGPLRSDIGVAEHRAIRLGTERLDGWIEVVEGLKPGDLLVDPKVVANNSRVRVAPQEEASHGVH